MKMNVSKRFIVALAGPIFKLTPYDCIYDSCGSSVEIDHFWPGGVSQNGEKNCEGTLRAMEERMGYHSLDQFRRYDTIHVKVV